MENVYPSIKYALVEKAVDHFSKNMNTDENTTIKKCLEMLKFAMSSNILTFRGKYYEYNGEVPIEKRDLTIGGFESAWLADLTMAFFIKIKHGERPF